MRFPRLGALCAGVVLLIPATAFADTATDAVESEVLAQWQVTEDRGTTFTAEATLTNNTSADLPAVGVTLPFRHPVADVSGGLSVQDESTLTLTPPESLAAGASHTITLQIVSTGPVSRVPSTCLSQSPCRVVIIGASPSSALRSEPTSAPLVPQSTPTPSATPIPNATTVTGSPETESPTAGGAPQPTPTPTGQTGTPTPQPSNPTPSDTIPAIPQPTAPETIVPSPTAPAGLFVTYDVTSDWGHGQSVTVTVRNAGTETIEQWAVEIPANLAVQSLWNAESTSGGGIVRASNAPWNGRLAPDEAIEFGFNASAGVGTTPVQGCTATADDVVAPCQLQP
ncbi:cellulose binding domain-containing protein [Candidatus Nanopelagicales bacterium]|nr:cellulose binding domain-containing protein [Candidatus Nanopelagicales bacterium]